MAEREIQSNESFAQLADITPTLAALQDTDYREGGHSRMVERAQLAGRFHISVGSLTTEGGPNVELIADLHDVHRTTLIRHGEIVILPNGQTNPVESIQPTTEQGMHVVRMSSES